jgi:DNA-binding response OmpR family regulator
MRVLLVEDDRKLAGYVRKGLEEEGYGVRVSLRGVGKEPALQRCDRAKEH